MEPLTDAQIDRFWSKVDKDGPVPPHQPHLGNCWVWKRGCNGSGYGQFTCRDQELTAHRVSWQLERGPIPDGMFICHACDNRKCVNPDHLFVGTNQDNMDDMWRKGRATRHSGERHARARLTEQDVIYIRKRYALGGISYEKLGAEFNVTHGAIGGIIRGKNWKSVTRESGE